MSHPPPTAPRPAVALTIAGSDPSGGAGLQADLKVFHQLHVYGTAVVSTLTVQNTRGIRASYPVPAERVTEQLDAVLDDLPVAATKTGALGSAATVHAVAERWRDSAIPLVVDPVLVSSSGHRLQDEDALAVLRDELLPRCRLLTPNLAEAEALSGRAIRGIQDMQDAGEALLQRGCTAVLVKGGHLDGEPVDLLMEAADPGPPRCRRFAGARVEGRHDHGTGCVLSAAITAGLALGQPLQLCIERAIGFVRAGLRTAPGLGGGRGPLDLWTGN